MAEIGILVIAYARFKSLQSVINSFPENYPRLYVVDGPKPPSIDSNLKVRNTILENIRPNCDMYLFRDTNLGGPLGIPAAISYGFTLFDNLLIIEDDCVCSRHIVAYMQDVMPLIVDQSSKIFCACMSNPADIFVESNILSPYFLSWGWLLNKQKWLLYQQSNIAKLDFGDTSLDSFTALLNKSYIKGFFANRFWRNILKDQYYGKKNNWDARLTLWLLMSQMYVTLPNVNLIKNTGFRGSNTILKRRYHDLSVSNLYTPTHALEYYVNIVHFLNCHFYRVRENYLLGHVKFILKRCINILDLKC